MMYDFVFILGSYGHPFENWEPWLFNVLTSEGKQVLAPQFPCIDQNYENWKRVLDAYKPFIGEKTSFIGHSLGPAFIVDYLIDEKIKINKKNNEHIEPFVIAESEDTGRSSGRDFLW